MVFIGMTVFPSGGPMGNDRILAIDPKFPLCYVRAHGDVAQLGERSVRNAEARGSIPLISTKKESADAA